MRRVVTLARKDLLRRARSPLGVLLLLVFPVVFAGILGVVFGRSGETVPKVHLLIEDRDGGLASGLLRSAFASEEAGRYFLVEEVGEEGGDRLERGEASALLRVPEGFTQALLDGEATRLELVRNPAQGILPEIAEQSAGVFAEILSAAARVLREPLDRLATLRRGGGSPTDDQVSEIAVLVNRTMESAGTFVLPPAITLETGVRGEADEEGGSAGAPDLFLLILPGVSVYALFMLGDLAMRDVLDEQTAGTLRRQLVAPVGVGTIVAGKVVQAGVLALGSIVVLAAIGGIVGRRPVDPLAFVLLSLAVVLAVTGAGAVIYGIARNQGQGATIASVIYLLLAFSGGSFIPTGSLPAILRGLAPYSLFYWGGEGYRVLLDGKGGVADVSLHLAVLAGTGVVLLGIGTRLLRRRLLRGAA